jgi:class 3 adenylate cyclase
MTARTDPEALLRAAREEAQSTRDLVRRRWIIAFGVVIAVLGSWVLFRLVHVALQ